ncbi:hypothetical protein EVG20_g8964 [Dentipellis fragilis]|uniref:ubiquitinyl hydrolase 1 n=1 Tax=Dentipellis fragilis TaxID=205917 RepID=A0A4Y9Y426_9AGAM|nr:hypothetical protein EVG20_g8964 [Dentipellis fragilis]
MTTDDSSTSLSLEEKYALVEEKRKGQMKEGETWYLVSRQWFRRWQKAMTGEQDKEGGVDEQDLGPVDNSALLDTSGQLIKAPVEGVHVEFVPEDVWELLVSWYGKPNHTIRRQVVTLGIFQETCLELHPLRLKVFRLTDNLDSTETSGTSEHVIYVSSTRQVKDVLQDLARAIHPSLSEEFRVWRVTSGDDLDGTEYPSGLLLQQNTEILEPSDQTLPDALIESEDSFVVEFAQDGKWIMTELPPLATQGGGFFGDAAVSTTVSLANEPGALGLGNLGNTCFMNSALQCLSHIQELSDYFTTGAFEGELNRENPLGMKGAIAETFGALLRRIWSTTSPVGAYSPRQFKSILQRFAPQFSGYHQQDSQELVAFLLDGLHEDLNRVKERPYVEKPD